MRFTPLAVAGAFAVGLETNEDSRGSFERSFCEAEFQANGIDLRVAQCNISWNRLRGTLRGIHFQREPHAEPKLVRCTRGAAFDVVVDLRKHSPTYLRWDSLEITAQNRLAMYVPPGCGHGFQSLVDDTELFYIMGESYYPALADGIHWKDPAVGVQWPILSPIVSDRDAANKNLEL